MAYTDNYETWKEMGRPGGSFGGWQSSLAAPAQTSIPLPANAQTAWGGNTGTGSDAAVAQANAAYANGQRGSDPTKIPGYSDPAAFGAWYNAQQGGNRPEDLARFLAPGGDFNQQGQGLATLAGWDQYLIKDGPNAGKYRSMRGASGAFDKPVDCPDGLVPGGPDETDGCISPNGGAGGGGGGGNGGGGYQSSVGAGWGAGTAGAVPQFNAPVFKAPSYQEAMADPGYQFSLNQGVGALEKSAAARGIRGTGGHLKDIIGYGQDRAAQQYGDVYNRAANTFGINYQGAKDEFAPQYGGWQTMYGGDLSRWTTGQNDALSRWTTGQSGDLQKYLQREGNIYGLINQPYAPPPAWA